MVVGFVTHAANQPHQAMGIGLVHFAVPKRFTCGTEFVAGGDDGDTEARPNRDRRMAHGAQRPTFAGVRWAPANKPAAPLRDSRLASERILTNGCGQGHLAIPNVAALNGEDGVTPGGIGAPVMMRTACPGSSGAMSSCAAAATVL